uniref:Uncharacterized protein n=1 Tax=Pipistrellus kuhlii TaxID=59472 RepID=A0A7J7X024_PIPKU|nr:hypothetical protein mPipKuh1_010757 [Pipistrellus kuhlii]
MSPHPGCVRKTASPKREQGSLGVMTYPRSQHSALLPLLPKSRLLLPRNSSQSPSGRLANAQRMIFPGWFTENHVGGAGNGTPEHSIPFRFQTHQLAHGSLQGRCTPPRHQAALGSVAPASHQPGNVVPNPSPRGRQPVPFYVFVHC